MPAEPLRLFAYRFFSLFALMSLCCAALLVLRETAGFPRGITAICRLQALHALPGGQNLGGPRSGPVIEQPARAAILTGASAAAITDPTAAALTLRAALPDLTALIATERALLGVWLDHIAESSARRMRRGHCLDASGATKCDAVPHPPSRDRRHR
jgi:hypothetical protein